ncbi:hypothetical protein ACFE04_016461 [Oxalis oulophora]
MTELESLKKENVKLSNEYKRQGEKYLAKRFMSLYRDTPSLKLSKFHKIVKEEFHITTSSMKASSTRATNGGPSWQFSSPTKFLAHAPGGVSSPTLDTGQAKCNEGGKRIMINL